VDKVEKTPLAQLQKLAAKETRLGVEEGLLEAVGGGDQFGFAGAFAQADARGFDDRGLHGVSFRRVCTGDRDTDDILRHISCMRRADTRDRLERLDLLASRLKAEEPMTVAGLAAEFGVSARTLFRDLAILRERGLPVEADRGRGGGVRLHRTWGIGRLTLSYREAVDLLVSLAIAEQLRSPWLIANLAPIRRKLRASFAPALRDR